MEFVEALMEAFVVFAWVENGKGQFVVEHDDEVDGVRKQVEVVNELVEEQSCYYYSSIEPLHWGVVEVEVVCLASSEEIHQVEVASEAFAVVHS